jgi:iron complex outermembrane receptor protein
MASTMLSPVATSAQQAVVTLSPVVVEDDAPTGSTRDAYAAPVTTAATKTDTPVIETPQAVSTVTRKQMDDQNTQSVKDALNYTAGVLSTPDATGRYDSLFMRGYGGFGTSTRIVDFLDGLKLPRGQGFALPSVDPYLLDHLEVLKGPSAVLYGQTSPGGLVNQVSRAPSATPYNEVKIETGTNARLQGGVTSQGALDAGEQWQYSFSAVGRSAETRYDDVEEKRAALAPTIKWVPNDNTQLSVQGTYQRDPDGGYFNSTYPKFLAPAAYKSALDRDLNMGDPDFDSYARTQYGAGYSFDHRFNDLLSVSSKTRYNAIDLDFKSLQMSGPLTSAGLIPRQALHSIETVDGISSDNHAQFDFATGALEHTALAGLDYQHSTSDWEYQWGTASDLDLSDPDASATVGALATIIDNKQTLQQTGAYLQDQLTLGRVHAVVGARYDWTDQDTDNQLTDTTSSQSSNSASYRTGLLYKFDNGVAPYASYSTSFEPTVGVDSSGTAFKPTEGKQWEAGVKYEPTFMKALFTVSAFHIRQQNVLTPDVLTGFSVQQGEVRSRGLEFEARGNVTSNLELIGAFTLLDTELTETATPANLGNRPQAAPTHYGSAWANYSFDSGMLDGFTLGSGLRFVGSSYADDANTIETDGYTLVDASASYALGKLSPKLEGAQATLSVTNLFDKEYYSSCSSSYYCQYGNGTQALLGLRYSW